MTTPLPDVAEIMRLADEYGMATRNKDHKASAVKWCALEAKVTEIVKYAEESANAYLKDMNAFEAKVTSLVQLKNQLQREQDIALAKVAELAASRDGWANSWQVCDADRQQLKAALAEMTAHRDKLRDAIRWYGDGDKRADAILQLEEARRELADIKSTRRDV